MPVKYYLYVSGISIILISLFSGCGSDDNWVEQHGYGPVEEKIELGDMDVQLARKGMDLFNSYCSACHAMEASISGPAMRRAVQIRTPEFIMNYILNPAENLENHPVGQELSGRYAINMANMGLGVEEARAIYEYFRYYDEHGADPDVE